MPWAKEGALLLLHNSAPSRPAEPAEIAHQNPGSRLSSVEDIPEDILLRILQRASEGTGGLEAAGVCRQWRRLSRISQLRLFLPSDVSEATLMALLARYPNVRVLTLDTSARGRKQLVSEAEEYSESWDAEEDDSQSPFLAKGQEPSQRPGALLGWAYRGLSLLGTSRAQRQRQGLRPRHGRGVAPVCSASGEPLPSDTAGGPGPQ